METVAQSALAPKRNSCPSEASRGNNISAGFAHQANWLIVGATWISQHDSWQVMHLGRLHMSQRCAIAEQALGLGGANTQG
jgi:hypothetical protein